MSNISKEIDKIVQDAARKKKEQDKLISDTEKTGFTSIAIDTRKKIENDLKKTHTDHSRLFIVLLSAIIAAFAIILIYQYIQFQRESNKNIWIKPVMEKVDLDKAREYVSGLLLKGNISLDSHMKPGIPGPWKKNSERIYREINGGRSQVLEAIKDDKKLGSEPLVKVSCSSPEPNGRIIFYLFFINKEFLVFKVDKIQINPDTKTGDSK
ncbi:MAG: hypothetical protein WAX69_07160 [Victivallales bacterium]